MLTYEPWYENMLESVLQQHWLETIVGFKIRDIDTSNAYDYEIYAEGVYRSPEIRDSRQLGIILQQNKFFTIQATPLAIREVILFIKSIPQSNLDNISWFSFKIAYTTKKREDTLKLVTEFINQLKTVLIPKGFGLMNEPYMAPEYVGFTFDRGCYEMLGKVK